MCVDIFDSFVCEVSSAGCNSAKVGSSTMTSVAEKKGQAVKDALAKTDDIKPAVTTEENEVLEQYSKALLEQAIEIGKDNEHYDKYNFVQLPYAKLQNGSEHHEGFGIYFVT